MGELVAVPIRLSPAQEILIGVVVAGLVLALLVTGLLEGTLTCGASLFLRLAGRRSPEKSAIGRALDDIEARLERREREDPASPDRDGPLP